MSESSAIDKPSKDLILQKWLRRLEDPNRPQIKGQLRTVDEAGNCNGMCAMGEFADVLVAFGIGTWEDIMYISNGLADSGCVSAQTMADALSISIDEAIEIHDGIANKNDAGVSFAEIAQLVRREFNLDPNS